MTAKPQSLDAFLDSQQKKDHLRLLACGHVDDGKSTLLGRLLYDTQSLYRDQILALQRDSAKRQGPRLDYSLLLDGLLQEREQGITIDVAYRFFYTSKRSFIVQDAPGHLEYTRNMVTAASTANVTLLLIDAKLGVQEQTKRHAFIASLLGVKHFIVAVNKMDAVDYSEQRFDEIIQAFSDYAIKLELSSLHFVPVSALRGDNVTTPSAQMPWYSGATLLSLLENIQIEVDRNLIDLRLPIQSAVRTNEFRGYMGTLASGAIRTGDAVYSLPGKQEIKVRALYSAGKPVKEAFANEAITIELSDDIDLSRGDMLIRRNNQPKLSDRLEVMAIALSEHPLTSKRSYWIKICHQMVRCLIEEIRYLVSIDTLHRMPGEAVMQNQVARIALRTAKPCIYDAYTRNRVTGAAILIDAETDETAAALMVLDRSIDHVETTDSHSTAAESPLSPNAPSDVVPKWILCSPEQLQNSAFRTKYSAALKIDRDELGMHFASDEQLIALARLCNSSDLSCLCAIPCSKDVLSKIASFMEVEVM